MIDERIKNWFFAFRPKTLTAAIVPIVSATALAQHHFQQWKISIFVFSLLSALFIQIGTNLVNDAIDFKKGTDREDRIGPRRVTQSGIFTFRNVFWTGAFFFFLAILCGIPLVIIGGWPILLIGVISIFLGYFYTIGPYSLSYQGWGDLFVIFFFGLIAVIGVYYLHTETFSNAAVIMGLQIGFLATVLIAVNNLRDIEQDRRSGKKTIPVRFGIQWARSEIVFLCLMPFVFGLYWLFNGFLWAFLFPLLCFPIAIRLIRRILKTSPGPIYNQFLAESALFHLIFGLTLTIGILLQ